MITPNLKREFVSFSEREERLSFLVEHFGKYLFGHILDVGCDTAVLRARVAGLYVGIDIRGIPDVRVDLEKVPFLPFKDASFDCVVCLDVLEHLDNLHHVFGELVRISRRFIIVSLPNNWANARKPIERGRGHIGHYGLPPEPPLDRHKWFFSFSEALTFLQSQVLKYSISLKELLALEKPRLWLVRTMRRLRWISKEAYLNRYVHSLWAVFEKDEI